MSPPNWGAATMEEVTPEPPRPLFRDLPPADQFPVDARRHACPGGVRHS
jgi:hypothetical protein